MFVAAARCSSRGRKQPTVTVDGLSGRDVVEWWWWPELEGGEGTQCSDHY